MGGWKYHPGSDTYRCPANKILRSNGKWYQRRSSKHNRAPINFKYYQTDSCPTCPLKDQCTSSPRDERMIPLEERIKVWETFKRVNRSRAFTPHRTEHQGAIDRNNARVNSDPEYYRIRQQIIEHQFGTFKRQWGFTHVLMRGKENVLGEVSILFTAYNLRRSVSILGFEGLLERLNALFLELCSILQLRNSVAAHMLISILSIPKLYGASGYNNVNYKL